MNKQAFLGGVALLSATLTSVVTTTAPAAAVLVTVGGQQYKADLLPTATFTSNQSLLESQPWWGNQELAFQFATAVNTTELGEEHFPIWPIIVEDCGWKPYVGPYYVWAREGGDTLKYETICPGTVDVIDVSISLRYGVATLVPEPFTILGTITAAGFGVAFKKRKKDSNKA